MLSLRSMAKGIRRIPARWRETHAPSVEIQSPIPRPVESDFWRVGVLGAGRMGRTHCNVLSGLTSVKLLAVADRSADSLRSLPDGIRPPVTRHYSDAHQLLANEKLDLVTIATNSSSHLELARVVIDAGIKRLIVEKPMGICLAEARSLAESCKANGVSLSINLSRRWSSDYLAIKRYLSYGDLGAVRQITVVLGQGGWAMTGVHFLDLMRYLADAEPAWVTGFTEGSSASEKRPGDFWDPGGFGVVGFENGARGFIDLSTDLIKRERLVIVRCEYGRIEVDERARSWTVVTPNSRRITFGFKDPTSPSGLFGKAVAEALVGNGTRCDGLQGARALEMVMAMHLSSQRDHRPVSLPLSEEDAQLKINFP